MSQSLKEALEIGLDCARAQADIVHRELSGYKPHKHAAADDDVRKIVLALEALSAQQGAQEPAQIDELIVKANKRIAEYEPEPAKALSDEQIVEALRELDDSAVDLLFGYAPRTDKVIAVIRKLLATGSK